MRVVSLSGFPPCMFIRFCGWAQMKLKHKLPSVPTLKCVIDPIRWGPRLSVTPGHKTPTTWPSTKLREGYCGLSGTCTLEVIGLPFAQPLGVLLIFHTLSSQCLFFLSQLQLTPTKQSINWGNLISISHPQSTDIDKTVLIIPLDKAKCNNI